MFSPGTRAGRFVELRAAQVPRLNGFYFAQFRLGGGELLFQILQFRLIVHLFFGPGDLQPQILDPLMERVDLLLDFFVHDQ